MPDATYQPKIYKDDNGDRMVVKSGGTFDAEAGASVKLLGGAALAATSDELNRVADVSARLVAATAATLAVTEAAHDGKTILLDRAGGVTATLPAATGSGARYRFVNKTALSGGSHVIQVTGNDTMKGVAWMALDDAADAVKAFETASDSDTITLDGTTKGGAVGDVVEVEDIATDVWAVQCRLAGTGTEVTPFSAAVT